MLAEDVTAPTFDLTDDILRVLPSDPYDQLDVARKITSLALSVRISELEYESSVRDRLVADLRTQIQSLNASLADAVDRLARAECEKEELLRENASLSETVKKLNRDVAKLEVFQRTLMHSLREDDESFAGIPQIIARPTPSEDDGSLPPSSSSSVQSRLSEMGNSSIEDPETEDSRPGISHGLILSSRMSTPQLTPLESPLSLSLSVSPSRVSKAVSPRRQPVSFATPLDKLDDRSSSFSLLPSSRHGSVAGFETGSQTGDSGITRVDGKAFLRQVRTRLPYEQFAAFLANVKDLNSRKQSKEETLRNATEIFGSDNKDLYNVFERFLTRHTD